MKKTLLLSLITLSLFQFSCKKDDDATFTQDTNTGLVKDGTKASGTISTTSSSSNVAQSFSFSHEYAAYQTLYYKNNQEIDFYVVKDFVSGYGGETDQTSGYFYFNAADSIHSAPTSYSIYMSASNATSNSTFVFYTGNSINQANSTITNYSLNGSTISFTVTTTAGYMGDNGKNASVVLNLTLPYTTAIYRKASN